MEQVRFLMALLGLEPGRTQYVPRYEADCVFTRGAGGVIEFIVPRGGVLARFNKGLGGLHHIALEVDDIRHRSEQLRAEGVELLEREPVDAGRLLINFLPPAYTRGLIVELVQTKADSPPEEPTPMAETATEAPVFESADYPLTTRFIADLLRLSPTLLRGQVAFLIAHRGEAFWREAERLLSLTSKMGGDYATALVDYTVVYLKEQVRFLQTKEYSHRDFETARAEVYDNPDVMDKFYLEGLLISHAFWPIHFDIHSFFKSEFLPRVPDEGVGAEYGFGHGLYLHDILTARPGTTAKGFDISPFSRKYAERLLRTAGIAPDRFRLDFADVREPLTAADREYSWAVFAEIMEHIPDPLFSLKQLHRCMRPGAPIFITTVVNSNAIDHLYLFQEPGEVRSMLEQAGFEVAAEKLFRVADYAGNAKDPSIDLAYVGLAR